MAFDTVMSVDWSASSIPKRGSDSCWVASMRLWGARRWMVENPATRLAAMETIRDVIDDEMRAGRRCLIVIDVSLGFPAGTADVLGLRSRPRWRAMWRALESRSTDTPENVNNRIARAVFVFSGDVRPRHRSISFRTYQFETGPFRVWLTTPSPRYDEAKLSLAVAFNQIGCSWVVVR